MYSIPPLAFERIRNALLCRAKEVGILSGGERKEEATLRDMLFSLSWTVYNNAPVGAFVAGCMDDFDSYSTKKSDRFRTYFAAVLLDTVKLAVYAGLFYYLFTGESPLDQVFVPPPSSIHHTAVIPSGSVR